MFTECEWCHTIEQLWSTPGTIGHENDLARKCDHCCGPKSQKSFEHLLLDRLVSLERVIEDLKP